MTLTEQFADNLRAIRRSYGWSQETVAELAGLHRTEVQRLESGKREPRLSTIVRLAVALRVDPGLLVVGLRPETAIREDGKRKGRSATVRALTS
jgi:transcriptional regulator with XRE-family HTH domain